jgi:hypothetical protein
MIPINELPPTSLEALQKVQSNINRLTETLVAQYDQRETLLKAVAFILCPYHIGDICTKEEAKRDQRIVITGIHRGSADGSRPYTLRFRILVKKTNELGTEELWLDLEKHVLHVVGRFAGPIPSSSEPDGRFLITK